MKNTQKIIFNRRLRIINSRKMTLIIGVVCEEGVLLVGDTKIVDTGKMVVMHENKIFAPLSDKQVAVGAAGLTDVFKRFNRRIPIVSDRKEKEIQIFNEEKLRLIGKSITDYEQPVSKNVQGKETEYQEPIPSQNNSSIKPPYVYTGEDFLGDCKSVIHDISEEERQYYPNPIEVLLTFRTGTSQLYHINSYGFESEVNTYKAIGSGSVYVDMFFQKLWKKKTYAETIPLACFVIKFIQNMELDNFVGVKEGQLPQVVVLPHNDKWGDLEFSNVAEFLEKAKHETVKINNIIEQLKLPKLLLSEGCSLDNY